MITSAGRLSRTTSQGSASRSAMRRAAHGEPDHGAERHRDARTTAATRASVAPRLKASAPERASATIASATACGSGSRRAPGNVRAGEPGRDAAARARASRSSRFIRSARAVERAGIERLRPDRQVGAADLGEHAIERAARPPLRRRAAGAGCPRGSAGGRSRARRRRSTPMRGASRCHSASDAARISLACCVSVEETIEQRRGSSPPSRRRTHSRPSRRGPWRRACFTTSSIATARLHALPSSSAQKFQNVSVASISPCSAFCGQQRRRAVDDRRLRLQIEARAPRQRLQQQPALVERPAGDARASCP